MGNFHNHPTKEVIRTQWCKPILKYIKEFLGYKLVYLGLPGIEAYDIISWLEYLDRVIAFECGDYQSSDLEKAKENIDKLNEILSSFERKGLLQTYSLYNGYIEKVILKGRDDSGDIFSLDDIVTVYNLDFCNSLTVPMTIVDDKGNVSKHYKSEVICKLLELQRDFDKSSKDKKFVMFLTIHSKFWEDEAERLFQDEDSEIFKSYLSSIVSLPQTDKEIRLLKAYVIKIIRDHFCFRNFIPEILPPIFYEGTGNHWLLCFTIIGTYIHTASSKAPCNQDLKQLLYSKFIGADQNGFQNLTISNIEEFATSISPVELLSDSVTCKKHWRK